MPKSQKTISQIDVLISSTRTDLEQYCGEAVKIVNRIADYKDNRYFLNPVSMEREPQSGKSESPVQVSLRWVEESEWMVLIVGWNYGTIPDDPAAQGLSVTELEYRHALSHLKVDPHRRLFVFMAGEPDTGQAYRFSDSERKDLKDWAFKYQSAQAIEKANAFRNGLKTSLHTCQFANLDGFRQSLDEALKNALNTLPPPIGPGTALAGVMVAVGQPIRACIRGVTMIANCKEIHDRLHELRHRVIRPLRDEVLSVWQQDGTLSARGQWRLSTYLGKMSAQVGAIRVARKSIGVQHWLLGECVDHVLGSPEWPNPLGPEFESVPDLKLFTDVLDTFAGNVQTAFREADRSMHDEEINLGEHYLALRDQLQRGRRENQLGPLDQQRLDEELKTVEVNRSRMKDTLTVHHSWQLAHDQLEEVNDWRDWPKITDKLNRFKATPLKVLLTLTNNALGVHAAADHEGSSGLAVLDRTTATVATGALEEQLRELKEKILNFEAHPGLDQFDEIRKPFDEAFFLIDRRTKAEVERARERVGAIEQWFDAISATPPQP